MTDIIQLAKECGAAELPSYISTSEGGITAYIFTTKELEALRKRIEDEMKERNTQDLIYAANARASLYDGDDRQNIKTDVMNAFYAGAEFIRSMK